MDESIFEIEDYTNATDYETFISDFEKAFTSDEHITKITYQNYDFIVKFYSFSDGESQNDGNRSLYNDDISTRLAPPNVGVNIYSLFQFREFFHISSNQYFLSEKLISGMKSAIFWGWGIFFLFNLFITCYTSIRKN